jgi:hypothetical protein
MIARLENVLERLEALVDPNNGNCTVAVAAKKEARLYVNSWIKPDVEALLAWSKGERPARQR